MCETNVICFRVIRLVLVVLTIGLCTAVRCRNKEFLNPEWIDPHDWTTAKDSIPNCEPQSTESKPCEPSVKSEYFRLVNSLFNPNEFQVRVIVVENYC